MDVTRTFELVVFEHEHENGKHTNKSYDSILPAINALKQIVKDQNPHSVMLRENEKYTCGIECNGPVLEWVNGNIKLFGKDPV